jgi:hypothetical protein
MSDPEQHMVIVASRDAWLRQARQAWEQIEAAAGGAEGWKLRDAYRLDPKAFALFIEAMHALGACDDPELIALAGLKPVDEII